MSTRITVLAPVFILLLAACSQSAESVSPGTKTLSSDMQSLNGRVGWVHGHCLVIRNPTLRPGDTVQVVLLTSPQQLVASKVTGIATTKNECPALHEGRAAINRQEGRIFYVLDIKTDDSLSTGIGLVGNIKIHMSKQGVIEFDLNEDGVREHAGDCTTSEGAIFYVTREKIFDRAALWSDYYYLGYDIEPSCPLS